MKKLSLTVIGFYVGILAAFSQQSDSSTYKNRQLQLDEVNFVSGYYQQEGDHSAVTGGTGSEHLTDFANTIDLKLSRYDRRYRRHEFLFEMGVDHYTSASSDKIDPHTISSASSADTRLYPSLGWTVQNEKKRTTVGLNASFSNEFDYRSFGIGASFSKQSKDESRDVTIKAQAYFDQWSVILPIELRTNGNEHDYPTQPRNSYSASFSLAQVINQRFQLSLTAEPTYQSGLLATKYQRVYFADGSEQSENLPGQRFKLPLGIRANYFLGDRFILRSFYRYYQDDWGLKAHTAEVEIPVKITPFLSLSPFYRYYTQDAIRQFAPYGQHSPTETYFTSDYDLSGFHSQYVGAGIRLAPPGGVLHIQKLNSLELRYGRYMRSDGLRSSQLSLSIKVR